MAKKLDMVVMNYRQVAEALVKAIRGACVVREYREAVWVIGIFLLGAGVAWLMACAARAAG